MNNQKPTIEELISSKGWIKFTKRLEVISLIFIVIGLLLYYTNKSKEGIQTMLLATGLSTIGMVYFFMAYKKLEVNSRILSEMFYKLYGFILACTTVTFLFNLQRWPLPYQALILVCLVGILTSLAISLRLKNNPKIQEDKFHFIRIIIGLALLMIMVIRHF